MKLEYGKRYVRRDGKITDPLVKSHENLCKFLDPRTEISYKENGNFWIYDKHISDVDLVSEYIEQKPISK